MPIKAKLTAVEFAALPESQRAFYVLNGDGYTLAIEGGFLLDTDPAALLNAKQHEVAARKEAERKLKELQDAQQATIDAAAAKAAEDAKQKLLASGNTPEILKKFQDDLELAKKQFQTELEKRDTELRQANENAKAAQLASHVSSFVSDLPIIKSPAAKRMMELELQSRLALNEQGQLVIKDQTGVVNAALTLAALKKEIVDNPDFAGIIVGSKGSGASGSKLPGAPVDTAGKKFDQFSSDELVHLLSENPTEYARLKAERYR